MCVVVVAAAAVLTNVRAHAFDLCDQRLAACSRHKVNRLKQQRQNGKVQTKCTFTRVSCKRL